jgi:hypothetical protein
MDYGLTLRFDRTRAWMFDVLVRLLHVNIFTIVTENDNDSRILVTVISDHLVNTIPRQNGVPSTIKGRSSGGFPSFQSWILC